MAGYAELGELNSNVMMARIELAMALAFQGDLDAAVGLCAQARATCEAHGERWAKAYALYVLLRRLGGRPHRRGGAPRQGVPADQLRVPRPRRNRPAVTAPRRPPGR
ncbi:hypothetical protein [Streptomyces sp. MZ04]|uniref:hypothetical protein n=1 Tax=Streptomyces sp. MZ04 TaxID=2559236 RepID=UPI00107E980A|nr:hypothetical protein [Streptomyces sp. MZ04]TGA84143.1 hypothetical protein E2651_42730 [Streptomyces sp. MZ04]